MFSIIKNLIDSGSYIFKSSTDKIDMLNNNDTSIEEKSKIIKSLLPKKKKEQLELLFDFDNNPDLEFDEIVKLFRSLTYNDKITSLNTMKLNNNKKALIDTMSNRQHIKIIKSWNLDHYSRQYIISLLSDIRRKILYYKVLSINYSDSTEILKYFSDKTKKKVLKKKSTTIKGLSDSDKVEIISTLSNDEDKLKYFSLPNNAKIKLSNHDKIKIIATLSDSKKLEFINGLHDNEVSFYNYQKKELICTLSDEVKLSYLDNPKELYKFMAYPSDEFFPSFNEYYTRLIIKNISNYKYKFTNNDLTALINNLNIQERLDFLEPTNKYNINLSMERKCDIICNLPTKNKIEILTSENNNELDLSQEHLTKILKSLSAKNIINLLIFNEKIKSYLSKKYIWSIIENLSESDADKILLTNDIKIKEFIETYKTSFVKCLDTEEKINVLYDKSKYNIHLEDNRKLKILKSISPYSSFELNNSNNIFNCFEDKDNIVYELIKEKKEFNKLHELFQTDLVKYFMNTNNNRDIEIGIDIIKYTEDPDLILSKYNTFKDCFIKLNINIYDFFQYGSNNKKYSWYNDILNILDQNKLQEFILVKDYFFNNYYQINNDSKYVIQHFLEILSSYNKYEILCTNLTNENKVLNKEEKEDIRYLFNQSNIKETPTKLEEVTTIRNNIIKSYKSIAENSDSIFDVKESLFNLFFDKSSIDIRNIINYTGGTSDLKILQFNNKSNYRIKKLVDDIIPVTSLIERLLNNQDINSLKNTLKYYCDENNIENTKRLFNYCSNYEEMVRQLYEYDMSESLTDISKVDKELYNTEKAKELSKKYGEPVIDLSENKYVLGAHVKSYSESVEDLLYGNSDGKSNFICLSPTSHRGQHYYAWGDPRTVFAYDRIPKNSFICSSISNMGSNSSLKYNTAETPDMYRTQKNILETSEASTGHNAEILLYRANLRPCGIIIPSGSTPSDDAIKYHKEFKLPFIITQEVDKIIENPIPLKGERKKVINVEKVKDKELLKQLKTALLKITPKDTTKKRIAVLADPHALYEPTLSCLVDIENKGIDEIYSLGDNIGHGPNPKEVLNLLNECGVKSIYGNHELYLTEGIKPFLEHFPSEESINRTKIMNEWMKSELSKAQIKEIQNYPERYEIPISKDKKITLIHTNRPYNHVGKYSNSPKIDNDSIIIRGHEHFESITDSDITLRGVGIGQTSEDDGYANYYIINIEGEKYNIEKVMVPYNRDNLLHTINESNMPVLAKSLISGWVGK